MDEVIGQILALVLAAFIGFIIGGEREKAGKPAGTRTLSLVCSASAFAAMITVDIYPDQVPRVLAGVITGIGFLGAGVIIAQSKNVLGVTTAATIWATAIIGMGIGMGDKYIFLASFFGLLVYFVLIERKLELSMHRKKSGK